MWGQFFTDILWEGVLSALRAAPLDLLSGSAGVNAGVPSLLEAFLNLVAVQVRGGCGCRVPHVVCNFNCIQLLCEPLQIDLVCTACAHPRGWMCRSTCWLKVDGRVSTSQEFRGQKVAAVSTVGMV